MWEGLIQWVENLTRTKRLASQGRGNLQQTADYNSPTGCTGLQPARPHFRLRAYQPP